MTPKAAVQLPTQAELPLVRGLARAAVAVLDPALSPNAILEILAEHARELVGAELATLSLTENDNAASTSGSTLRQAITDDTGRMVGTIVLSRKDLGAFTVEDEEILRQLAQLAAVAIHNARVRDTLRLSEERLRLALDAGRDQIRHAALNADVSLALTTGATIGEMLQQCAEAIVRHNDAAFARIWTVDRGSRVLNLQASAGMYTHLDGAHGRVPIGEQEVGLIAQELRPYHTNQVVGDPQITDQAWAKHEGLVAFAGFPLVVGGQLVGVFALFARRPILDDELVVLDGAARTIALGIERKQAEAARDRALAEVAAERRRLEISNRELDQFAYVASHDLKAPLRGVANLAGWIEEDLQETMSEETREMLALLRGRMYRMEALIEGILEFSRAGRPRGQPEMVNVGTLVGEIIELLAPPIITTMVVKPGMPTMITDRLGLQQVFLNLIGNAIKYTRSPEARVEVSVADGGGAFYEFSVADNGPGIPIEFQERIWALFQALARDDIEGTGIGLSLVKKTVESRGGTVRLESEPGRGSTFSFLWPKHMPREGAR